MPWYSAIFLPNLNLAGQLSPTALLGLCIFIWTNLFFLMIDGFVIGHSLNNSPINWPFFLMYFQARFSFVSDAREYPASVDQHHNVLPQKEQAVCVCQDGYGSDQCNVWVGLWSNWSPWGKCTPACGRERWAVRTRKCLVESKIANPERLDCNGSALEYAACEAHPCARAKEDVIAGYFGVREQSLMSTLVFAAVFSTALALVWKLRFTGAISGRFRRLLITRRPS
ncbi:unnamed protein product [Schistocephalus solidus]|uniref:TSP1_spondin domain-containing protein n=1 Tax=Schistocephalus solidus TaxID=70667 RepID=A0A183SXM2_SCHSO|nr:unnamed protein product [Schistocephalus solidus]